MSLRDLPIVSILQIGFSGLAFLLAYFAFALLWSQRSQTPPQPGMLRAIKWFMNFALLMAIVALLPPLLDYGVKHLAREAPDKAETCLAARELANSAASLRRSSEELRRFFRSLADGTTSSGAAADEGRRVSNLAAAKIEQSLSGATETQDRRVADLSRLLACN